MHDGWTVVSAWDHKGLQLGWHKNVFGNECENSNKYLHTVNINKLICTFVISHHLFGIGHIVVTQGTFTLIIMVGLELKQLLIHGVIWDWKRERANVRKCLISEYLGLGFMPQF